ncbi:PIR Superfamily Protein [Plasmodium ovale curtisi]|uniref:PIR Superfamily Protein n=1 Tax=Plasmodium ovale curtisi TaxID=864141 RepID=A0A1A8WGE6_PLAOA|nr:PIR Superfamily Protein [Plasmodium ovale curtisi]
MEKRVNVLKDKLKLFNFNFVLNKPVTLCSKCKLCEEITDNIKNEFWFKIFCYQFVKNLEYAEYMSTYNNKVEKESRCKSLIYWMSDKVKYFQDNTTVKNKGNLVKEILGVWENFNKSEVTNSSTSRCTVPSATKFTNLGAMRRKNIMSDYCENYSELKSSLTRVYTSDCTIYYDYFKDSYLEFSKIATEHKNECLEISKCSSFCENYDPDDIFKNSKCEVIEISPKKNDYMKKVACEALKKPEPVVKYETKEVPIQEFTFSDGRAIILILFTLWGIFLTFLYLYKLAPFRSWISSKLGKKKIITDNFNEQSDDESLDDDYESINRNMQNEGYNITYNSNWNSLR